MTFRETNSTEFVPIPVGDYPFCVTKVEVTEWKSGDNTKSGLKCTLTGDLIDTNGTIKEATGRDTNTAKYEVMLDLTPEGGLAFGKGLNVRLGRLREATDLNKSGQDFNFQMFAGKMVTASIKHRIYNGEPIAFIDAVAKP